MQNNISTLPNTNIQRQLKSQNAAVKPNSGVSGQINSNRVQDYKTDEFLPSADEKSAQNAEQTSESKKDKFLKYAKKYALPAIALLGAIGIGAFFISRSRNKALKTKQKTAQLEARRQANAAEEAERLAKKAKEAEIEAQKQAEKQAENAKEIAKENFWLENSSRSCVYTSDMEEEFSDRIQYHASSSDTKTELEHWFNKLKKDDAKFVQTTGDKHANLEFTDFEILPHSYNDDTNVFYMAKCAGGLVSKGYDVNSRIDYDWYGFKTGSNDTYGDFGNPINKRAHKWLEKKVDGRYRHDSMDLPDYGHLVTTADDKGRKIVIFLTQQKTPITKGVDARGNDAFFVLRSSNDKFTNLQKDLIRIFSDPENQKYVTGENIGPLQTMVDYADGIMPLQNKTAFLSAIQSWAEHSKEADVDKIISDSNSILELHLV